MLNDVACWLSPSSITAHARMTSCISCKVTSKSDVPLLFKRTDITKAMVFIEKKRAVMITDNVRVFEYK